MRHAAVALMLVTLACKEGSDGPEVSPDMVIRDSIPIISGAASPARVVKDGRLLGVVGRDDLLAVIGGQGS